MGADEQLVLIVDHEPAVSDANSRVLSDLGYPCFQAGSVEEAEKLVSERSFALALCDLRISGGNGLSLLAELKRRDPDMAVIMVSAADDVQIAIDCLTKGADSYLIKPVNDTELREMTARALKRRRAAILERDYQQDLETQVSQRVSEVQRTFLSALESLAYSFEAKNPYSKGHSDRVARLGVSVIRAVAREDLREEQLQLAGKLHDVGNIGLKEAVLNKPGPLTEEEFELIKTHPAIAARILRPVIQDTTVTDTILYHHERYDGRGYPQGLKGDEIPLGARILTVADSFDAMTSPRPYRPPESPGAAVKEILYGAGTRYDPEIAKVLPDLLLEK